MRGKRRGERREAPSPVTTATDAGPSPGQSDPYDWPSVLPRPGTPPPPRGTPTGAPRPSDPTRQRGAARSALAHDSLPFPAAAATAAAGPSQTARASSRQERSPRTARVPPFPLIPAEPDQQGRRGPRGSPSDDPSEGREPPSPSPSRIRLLGAPKIPSVGELTFPHAYLWRVGGELLWVRPWRTLGFASSGAGLAPLL